ncbi:hypothetical protein QFZ24_005180 [Streptomyces phaeochromogenes]|nr:hypothetical protein [Streptomyces phaeochromogenes]
MIRHSATRAPVTLTLEGGPETGLTIRVTNPLEPSVPAGPVRDSARDPERGPAQDSVPNSTPNPAPGPVPKSVPGSGQGLIGMRERVDLVGGRLRHRTTPTDFHLDVWLPWTA